MSQIIISSFCINVRELSKSTSRRIIHAINLRPGPEVPSGQLTRRLRDAEGREAGNWMNHRYSEGYPR